MMTAGRRRRMRTAAMVLIAFTAFMHLLAYSIVGRFAGTARDADLATLVVISGSLLLSWSLMVSQAMESVTRAFYTRSDLDLILSSPADAAKVHCVRIAIMALSIALTGMLLAAPFINVLAVLGGARWLAAYAVVLAMGIAATAAGLAFTIVLFRTIGPRSTRLVAQILAAVIGVVFVIGLQVGAIASGGTLPGSTSSHRTRCLRMRPMSAASPMRRHSPRSVPDASSPASSWQARHCSAAQSCCSRRAFAIARRSPRALRARSPTGPDSRLAFARARRGAHCGRRSGSSCCAIHGSYRNR